MSMDRQEQSLSLHASCRSLVTFKGYNEQDRRHTQPDAPAGAGGRSSPHRPIRSVDEWYHHPLESRQQASSGVARCVRIAMSKRLRLYQSLDR